jgi:2-oxoisovalerate dehydrogenase E1 component
MAVAKNQVAAPPKSQTRLSKETLFEAYKLMVLSRSIDKREKILKAQAKVYFQMSGSGHEAILTAAGMQLKPGYDWIIGYYRDKALAVSWGASAYDCFIDGMAAEESATGGRQMPYHWSKRSKHILPFSSPVGSQFLRAVGAAMAGQLYQQVTDIPDRERFFKEDEVTLICGGDGATSEGEFWEALNRAAIPLGKSMSPVIFLIEDNEYAISVPLQAQTAGGNISKLLRGFEPLMMVREVDGCDFIQSYTVMQEVIQHVRKERKPALVHAHVIRMDPHSESDRQEDYRTREELEADRKKEPIVRLESFLVEENIFTQKELDNLKAKIEQGVSDAADRALEVKKPDPKTASRYVYSPTVDPTSEQFSTPPRFEGEPLNMATMINRTLADEMARNPKIVISGEDVADCSKEEFIDKVPGKGGVFKVTKGLQRKFGSLRVFNSSLAEATVVGVGVGLGYRGIKYVGEIQFMDYIWPAMSQIHDELAITRWKTNNEYSNPIVIRTTYGGYLGGGSIYHSQSRESIFAHIPGLRVVLPSTALDACGLLRTAIRCDDPVLFLEHKKLYFAVENRSPYPGPDFMIPFGKASIRKTGKDVSIITFGILANKAVQAAEKLGKEGIDVEVVDLRSLNPVDWETIFTSVKKTGKVVVAYEDTRFCGYGGEIAAEITEKCFEYLDAPIVRVAADDIFVAYYPGLEEEILPQTEDIMEGVKRVAEY